MRSIVRWSGHWPSVPLDYCSHLLGESTSSSAFPATADYLPGTLLSTLPSSYKPRRNAAFFMLGPILFFSTSIILSDRPHVEPPVSRVPTKPVVSGLPCHFSQ